MQIQTEEQRTRDWFRARLGKFTASNIGDLMTKGRGKDEYFGKSAMTYIYEVAAERDLHDDFKLTDEGFDVYLERVSKSSKAMQYGTAMESEARSMFASKIGMTVEEVGFVAINDDLGDSSDGVVVIGKKKTPIEIKCPTPAVFKQMCSIKDADDLKAHNSKYYYQCQVHCLAYDSSCCWFIACDIMTKPFLHIVKIDKDEKVCAEILERVARASELINNLSKDVETTKNDNE